MIPIYLDQVPAGSATRPFVHYAQLNQLERQFRMFDFGSEKLNIENYGQAVPPNHNLKNVQVCTNMINLHHWTGLVEYVLEKIFASPFTRDAH